MPRQTKRMGNFSQKFIDAIVLPNSRVDWWDEMVPGLLVRVSNTGSKVFYWMGRSDRRAVRVKIGTYMKDGCTIAVARDEARRIASEAFKGIKPKPVSTLNVELSLHKLWIWWLNCHAKPHRKDWKRDKSNYDNKLATWGTRKLSSITTAEVKQLHLQIGKDNGPAAANTAVKLLGLIYRAGIKMLKLKVDDPTKGVQLFHRPSRERFLKADEISAFLEAVEGRSPLMRDFILLALYTGARRSNVAGMKWADIDLQERIWRVRASDAKSKRDITIVLSQPAIDILKKRINNKDGSPYVLPSYGITGHVMTPQFAIQEVLKKAELSDITFHDLRRTLGSWMAPDTELSVIAKQLGHSSLASTAIYARLDLTEVRAAVEKAGQAISSMRIIQKNTENSLKESD